MSPMKKRIKKARFFDKIQLQRFLRSLRDFGRHRPKCAGTGRITTGTDRHKIARDEFY